MKNILFIILISCALKVRSQCTVSITPTYTAPTCSSCCDGIISFTMSGGSSFCSPSSCTLTSVCCSYFSCGTWSNLCAGSYTINYKDACCLVTCGVGLPAGPTNLLGVDRFSFVINIFPNPVSNALSVVVEQNVFENSEIEITNYIGQTVLKTSFKNEIDVSELNNGIYFLKMKGLDQKEALKKFVIAR